jgi:hypothetical protein
MECFKVLCKFCLLSLITGPFMGVAKPARHGRERENSYHAKIAVSSC